MVQSHRDADLDALIADLSANAAKPFEEARAMPPGVYHSPGFLALEESEIFRKEWICLGRAESIPETGDYIATDILDEPVVVVRGKDGVIRGFSNICLHRMARLLEGKGNARKIVCPYHAWTYGLEGDLIGAPHMEQSTCFDKKDYKLPDVRAAVWQGWIYVTLNPEAPEIEGHLRELGEVVTDRYRMENYVETFREEHVWDTNWKILAENFMESYHLARLHAGTIGPHSKVEEMVHPEGGSAFNYHWITKESSLALGIAHPDNEHLEGDWRKTTALLCAYPSHLVTLTPGYFWYLCVQPRGIGKVNIVYGGGFAPEFLGDPRGEEMVAEFKVLVDEANREDRIGVESVFNGTKGRLAYNGHLSHLERPNFEFGQYLARMVTGKNPAAVKAHAAE